MGVSITKLRDDFQDNLQANAWGQSYSNGSATRAETGGQLQITLPSSTAGAHEAGYWSSADSLYSIADAGCFINIAQMVSTAVAAYMIFDLHFDAINALRWAQQSGTVKAQKVIAGVVTDLFTATWSSTTYKYLRIREASGTLFWDSSTNGTTWTQRATLADPFAITDLSVLIAAGCGNVASPGSFRVEEFNTILPALATNWRWTQVKWPLTERFKVVTLAIDAADTVQGYVVTADTVDASDAPSGNVQYWAGPADGGRELTLCATQAQAQAMAVNFPTDGRCDLPTITEARCIRVYHRSIDGNAYTMREIYPRRLIQSDDIEAESIRAINIAASAITVDKLDATLTITGKTIQTDYSGARVVLSGAPFGGLIGYGATDTYNPTAGTGTYQILWSATDGKFYAGGGNVVLDASGITLAQIAGASSLASAELKYGANTHTRGYVLSAGDTQDTYYMFAKGSASGYKGQVYAECQADDYNTSNKNAVALIYRSRTLGRFEIGIDSAAKFQVDITNGTTVFTGLNVGSATGAGTGELFTSGNLSVGANAVGTIRCYAKGVNTTSAGYTFYADNSGGTNEFYVRNDGVGFLNNTAWTYSSDMSKKRNVRAMNRDIAHLMQLRAVRFDYIDGPPDRIGYIAQEVQAILPELIAQEPDGSLSMATTDLIPLLTHTFQRLIRLLITKGVIGAGDIA